MNRQADSSMLSVNALAASAQGDLARKALDFAGDPRPPVSTSGFRRPPSDERPALLDRGSRRHPGGVSHRPAFAKQRRYDAPPATWPLLECVHKHQRTVFRIHEDGCRVPVRGARHALPEGAIQEGDHRRKRKGASLRRSAQESGSASDRRAHRRRVDRRASTYHPPPSREGVLWPEMRTSVVLLGGKGIPIDSLFLEKPTILHGRVNP